MDPAFATKRNNFQKIFQISNELLYGLIQIIKGEEDMKKRKLYTCLRIENKQI